MKKFLSPLKVCLLLAGSAALVSSCQDYEPFSEQQVQDVAYTREFTRQFGDIDPNQNWDLFGQLTRGIGPTTRGAATQVTSRWTTETVTFTPTEIATYKQVLPESDAASRTLEQTNLGQVTQNFTTTARTLKLAPVYSVSSSKGSDEIGIYWYVQPGAASDVDQYGDKVETLTVMVDDGNGGVTARYIQRVPIIRSGPAHSNESFVNHMTENSDGSVTSNICEVTIPASITSYGFYITNHDYDRSTTPKTKYSESALNTKVPEYGDIDVSWAATFNLKELGLSQTDDQQYLCFEDWMDKNNFDLNDVVFGIKDFDPSTIIDHDAENEKAILVCEDLNNYDFDFNDVVLGLNYKEEAEYEWRNSTAPDGSTYKERILVPGSEKRSLTITPMAAGGAFESTVAFGGTSETTLGKIHALMGEDPVIESATGHNPLNPIFNATAEYKGDGTSTTFEDDDLPTKGSDVGIGEGFTYPTFLSKLFAQGYFKIYCTQGNSSGNVQARLLTNKTQTETDTYYDDETNTSFAQAPQMMLLPYYFEWPQEEKWIQDAYTGFADWVSDASKTDWIKTSQTKDLIVERGDFIEESTNPTVDPGNRKEEFNINVEQPKKFKYNETTTYNNGVFVPIGDDVLINEGATAELKVIFLYKPANTFYFDDANGNELFKDQSGLNNLYKSDGSLITTSVGTNYSQFNETWFPWGQFTPITITYPMNAEETSMAVNSGGIWIFCADDYAFKIQEVALLTVTGVTDPETVHTLTVSPTSMEFTTTATQSITATTDAGATITYVSSNTNVATVDQNGVVTPVSNGSATITVTATGGDLADRTKHVDVTVNIAHDLQVSTSSLTFGNTDAQTFTATSSTGNVSVVSSNDAVASVVIDANGNVTVTPVAEGSATITVTASDANNNYAPATQEVSVKVSYVPEGYTSDDACESIEKWGSKDQWYVVPHSIASANKAYIAIKVTGAPAGSQFIVTLPSDQWNMNDTRTITIGEGDVYELTTDNPSYFANHDYQLRITSDGNNSFTAGTIEGVWARGEGGSGGNDDESTVTFNISDPVLTGGQVWGHDQYKRTFTTTEDFTSGTWSNGATLTIVKSSSQNNIIYIENSAGTVIAGGQNTETGAKTTLTYELSDLANCNQLTVYYGGFESVDEVKMTPK